jgi:hypothetical protein
MFWEARYAWASFMFSLPLPLTTAMSFPKRAVTFYRAVLAFRLAEEEAVCITASLLYGSMAQKA